MQILKRVTKYPKLTANKLQAYVVHQIFNYKTFLSLINRMIRDEGGDMPHAEVYCIIAEANF